MTVAVKQRAPRVRCYKCGSPTVSALCHHCWRPGCARHVRPSHGWVEMLSGKEGSGPGLENVRACHCRRCAHIRVDRWLAIGAVGAVAVVAGFIAAWLSPLAGLILLAVSGLSAAWAYLHIRHRSARVRAGMPVLLHPKVADVRLLERLPLRITLGPRGDYHTDLRPVEGEFMMVLTFGLPDRDRVRRYVRKHRRGPGREVRFSAGRAVLQGQVGIKQGEGVPGPVLALDGDTSDYSVFRAEDPPASSSWNVDLRYELSADPDISPGPFWITPSIVPESDQRALELDIQWVEFGPDDKPLSLDVIERFQLRFPVRWGTVQRVSGSAITGLVPTDRGADQGLRSLEWRQLSPTEHQRQVRRLTLAVRFENRINRKDVLCGRLETTMKGTLSGVEGVRLYNSLGSSRRYPPGATIRTRIEADFQLSLAGIRYQAVQVVPDREAEDSGRDSYAKEFDVIPGNETVIALTNTMSERGYYVKRVIENPPRSGGRADVVQRYWDIAGRSYEGIYPVDFHLVLTGEEVRHGDIRPEAGTTKVRIVTKGTYTDDNDENGMKNMSECIRDAWRRLEELAEETLKTPG